MSEKITEREFHAVANLFPLMRGAAFAELVADIKKNGLYEPILVDAAGRILDGRNRYLACKQAGVEARYAEWQGEGELPELAVSRNLHRRHLGESQRAMVAARLAPLIAARRRTAGGRGANLLTSKRLKARDEAAAMVNVSTRLVIHACKVLKDGCKELIEGVASGKLALSMASALAGLSQAEQARVVAAGARAMAAKVREMRGGEKKAGVKRASLGHFGVLGAPGPGAAGLGGEEGVMLLWVPAGGVGEAVEALKVRGFEYFPEERVG